MPLPSLLANRPLFMQHSSRSAIHAGQPMPVLPSCPRASRSLNKLRQSSVAVHARRLGDWDSGSDRRGSRRRASADDRVFRLKLNQIDVALAEDQLWQLALPFAVLFGLAIVIGPLVVGLTLSAMAMGAMFSAGALAFTTMLLPLVMMMGVGGLMSFGLFAGLGAVFVLPKLVFSGLSLAVVGGGLALGWGGVNWLLTQQASNKGKDSVLGSKSRSSSSLENEQEEYDEQQRKQQRQVANELRQFDELLESKDRQRKRQW